ANTVKPTVVTVSIEKIITQRVFNPFAGDPFFNYFFGPGYPQQPHEKQFRQQGLGSGVIVSEDGYILTNNHVVQDADSIWVRTYEGHRYRAKVIGTDPKTDIAVLQIDAKGLPHIEIGDSDDLQVGEMVLAIGSPMSENLAYTVTQGIVSAKGRANVGLADYEDYIQTDAAINPGNSGGPLVDLDGKLVGLNAAIVSRSGGFQGIGFAVPVNMAMRVMNSLITTGKVERGWLGVTIQDVNEKIAQAMGLEETRGALVGDVLPDSPADKAGVKSGDLIVAVDGHKIESSGQLRSQIASTAPGTTVVLSVIRDGSPMDIRVKLGELPSDLAQASTPGELEDLLGFSVRTLTSELADQYGIDTRMSGVIVTKIDPESNAYQAGVREGDVITTVNRHRVHSSEQFTSLMRKMKRGDTVLLKINRGGSGFYVAFAL
ncbi:MAG: DegQ family serine endoprotease, partial [Candidatus Zixiibacteriota bacterium]